MRWGESCRVGLLNSHLFHKHKVYRQDEAAESGEMVPMQCLALKEHGGEHGEHNERDDLLDDLELHQRERPAITRKTNAVGRYLARVFGQRDSPRKEDDGVERPVGDDFHFLQFQVPVPGKGHEDVGHNEQEDGTESFHILVCIDLALLYWLGNERLVA